MENNRVRIVNLEDPLTLYCGSLQLLFAVCALAGLFRCTALNYCLKENISLGLSVIICLVRGVLGNLWKMQLAYSWRNLNPVLFKLTCSVLGYEVV